MKFFGGLIIGGIIAGMVWFPLGIMYAVEAVEPTTIMKILGTVKGLFG